ncbi:MAG: prepilin-type N-terminal cleavage/methylation domain-containing protein [Deltaproteobacteria bacterium]|jgi:type IV pilus assembly protein PilV|nr:prepilin-type N-terminal cleavage/methylation domain-containing protein [Deltaproteobacteria bacterium]
MRAGHPDGFTLVEILVSVVILSIGLVATILLQVMSIKHGTHADNLTVASLLAESEIERLRTFTKFNEIPNAIEPLVTMTREGEVCTIPSAACTFTMTTTLTPLQPTSRSHSIDITISWVGPVGPESISYEAILTDLNMGNMGAVTP